MVTRAMISFDIEKEGRWYHILIPNGAPYTEACDSLNEVITMIQDQQKAEAEKLASEQSLTASEAVTPEVVA